MHLRLTRKTQAEHTARPDAEIRDLKKLVLEIQAELRTCNSGMNSSHRDESRASLQVACSRGGLY
jgi:hypothetical protein